MTTFQRNTFNERTPMKDLSNPHDKIFKATFSRKEVALEYLQSCLPGNILAMLDLSTLQLAGTSFVNEQLKEYFADLVYTCWAKTGGKVAIPLVLEHKSSPPTYPPLQIMSYQVNGWQTQINNKQKPTPIIPIIFYHGKEQWVVRPWKDYLQGMASAFEIYTPPGHYVFTDLSGIPDDKIKTFRSTFMKMVMLLMKHRNEKEYWLNHLREIFIFVENFADWEKDRNEISLLILYFKQTTNISWEEFEEKIGQLPKTKKSAMTLYESIYEKEIGRAHV